MLGLSACSDPYAVRPGGGGQSPAAGVQGAPAGAQGPLDVKRSPPAAILQFAALYSNWSYRSLARQRLSLASISVGAARLSERQAAAATRGDSTLARARLANSGLVASVARDLTRPGWWVLVTREHTTGGGEYEGLAASFHVVLAQVLSVPGGWAVSQWLPQS